MAIRIPLHYMSPNFSLPMEEVTVLRNKNFASLLDRKKLHLILDLDNTLVYCLNISSREIIFKKEKELRKENLKKRDIHPISSTKAIKLRPGIRKFLTEASTMFDLSIYTMGDRVYADRVVRVLESEIKALKFTCVMTIEDCLNQCKLRKGLGNVLCHARVVLIVDDMEDFWPINKANLIQIGKYTFDFVIGKDNFNLVKDTTIEDEDDAEFIRVLDILKRVHNEFYDDYDDYKKGEKDYGKKDVRHILENISRS